MIRILFPIFFVICLIGGIASVSYTVNKCGWGVALLGKTGFSAATLGLCDKP